MAVDLPYGALNLAGVHDDDGILSQRTTVGNDVVELAARAGSIEIGDKEASRPVSFEPFPSASTKAHDFQGKYLNSKS